MGHIKFQNLKHFTVDGKRTVCNLSNQYREADTIEEFKEKMNDSSWTKDLCKKCQSKISK